MFTLFYERYLEYSKNKIYNFHESITCRFLFNISNKHFLFIIEYPVEYYDILCMCVCVCVQLKNSVVKK